MANIEQRRVGTAAVGGESTFVYLIALTVRSQFAYLGRVVLDILQPIITLVAFIYVWRALADAGSISTQSVTSLISYSVIATLVSVCLPTELVARALERDIGNGDIGQKLIRPMPFVANYLAMSIGSILSSIVRKSLPILVICALTIGRPALVATPAAWGTFALLLCSGIAVGFLIDLFTGYLCFWIFQGRYFRHLFEALFAIFSGQFIPLALLPDWMQRVSYWMPVRVVYNDPISVITGLAPPDEYGTTLLRGAGWLIALVVVNGLIHRLAVRRVVIQGG